MQEAFFLAEESIPWVRFASGNVYLLECTRVMCVASVLQGRHCGEAGFYGEAQRAVQWTGGL